MHMHFDDYETVLKEIGAIRQYINKTVNYRLETKNGPIVAKVYPDYLDLETPEEKLRFRYDESDNEDINFRHELYLAIRDEAIPRNKLAQYIERVKVKTGC